MRWGVQHQHSSGAALPNPSLNRRTNSRPRYSRGNILASARPAVVPRLAQTLGRRKRLCAVLQQNQRLAAWAEQPRSGKAANSQRPAAANQTPNAFRARPQRKTRLAHCAARTRTGHEFGEQKERQTPRHGVMVPHPNSPRFRNIEFQSVHRAVAGRIGACAIVYPRRLEHVCTPRSSARSGRPLG